MGNLQEKANGRRVQREEQKARGNNNMQCDSEGKWEHYWKKGMQSKENNQTEVNLYYRKEWNYGASSHSPPCEVT